ncbi:MAG: FAD binding domain-containing protein [Anaerolineaceae bacterium]|jgi:carbon-monoxide dehydrogenase medium subunit|nr:FAD binding domain-containing protein [Anaerolineaceae bacterium]MDD4041915.1 FAD binding domain-containing protein [Anaerolineaceae bacterium]MDD4577945.1 FAD binding domain-containing protein [Anaerolineaceae bacterium]
MWKNYHMPETVDHVIDLLSQAGSQTKIIAGGTDLMVEIRDGKWQTLEDVIDITRVRDLDAIYQDGDGLVHIQANVTHNDVLRSELIRQTASPLYQACYRVSSPQLRNRATVVGNLVTASPANDTIPPLMAMDASLVLVSKRGERQVRLNEFYPGLRKTAKQPDELVREIVFKPLKTSQKGSFIKQALRKTQAIATLNCCVILDMQDDLIVDAVVTMGSVAPTVIHALGAEEFLRGKLLSAETARRASELAALDTRPITDVRGGADYRQYMMQVIVEDALMELVENRQDEKVPINPVTLSQGAGWRAVPDGEWDQAHIETTINGQTLQFAGDFKGTLLNFVRERVGYSGSKPGCEEGECGACTMYLDGKAVVSCLVPAPRAHMANITTIEGLAEEGQLHPVQTEFINHGAVQCGYCTPGFVMAAAKMMEEKPHPSEDEIKDAISGNLCRCTGYYKIIQAIEAACQNGGGAL